MDNLQELLDYIDVIDSNQTMPYGNSGKKIGQMIVHWMPCHDEMTSTEVKHQYDAPSHPAKKFLEKIAMNIEQFYRNHIV